MGQITSLFAWKVVRQVSEGIDRGELLRSVGVDPEAPVDPKLMVDDEGYYDLYERIAARDPHAHDFSLRTGASMECADYGAFGLAFKSALTLGGSYERSERYARVLTSVTAYALEPTSDGTYMCLYRDGFRRQGLRMSNEASIAATLTLSREVTGVDVRPLATFFKHAAPPRVDVYAAFFGGPVHFDADRDAMLFSKDALQTQNRVGDESFASFFDTHLDAELATLEDDALEHRVRIKVSQALSEGVPKISDIAAQLAMSGRTLQRRLGEQGYSFQGLVDEARRQLAERLLRETDYALAEIAYLTGFSEQSAFTRAFKRWAGQTPRSYRLDPG